MKVVHFHRAKGLGVSIERVFDHVRSAFPEDLEVEVKHLPHGGTHPLKLLRNCWFAFRNQGDVNHVTGDCHYIALAMNPGKTILTVHDCVNLHKLSGLRRWIFKMLWYDLPCKWVKKITVISEFSKRELLEHVFVPADKIDVIYNCVDPAFKPRGQKVPSDPAVILQIGTRANKNLERVATALRGIKGHLRIIGDLSSYQKSLLDENRVDYSNVFQISDEELLQEFRNADVLLFASTYEGFGLPIIEAQAVGFPVITSNIEPMVEVAGGGALLVDPFDPNSIRTQVEVAMKSDLTELVEYGYSNLERFHANRAAVCYHAIYEVIVSAN